MMMMLVPQQISWSFEIIIVLALDLRKDGYLVASFCTCTVRGFRTQLYTFARLRQLICTLCICRREKCAFRKLFVTVGLSQLILHCVACRVLNLEVGFHLIIIVNIFLITFVAL